MTFPSSFIIAGVFDLSDGVRSTDTRYYTTYLSAISFVDNPGSHNVSVRKYTSTKERLYNNGTLVYLIAKAALPTNGDGTLDSIYCVPFGSSSEDILPSHSTNIAIVTGTITSADSTLPTHTFTVSATEYVRGDSRTSHLRFNYEGTSKRWKKTPLPSVGSTVIVTGALQDFTENGGVLNLLDISFGTQEAVAPPGPSPTRKLGYRKSDRTSNDTQLASPEASTSSSTRKIGYRRSKKVPTEVEPPLSPLSDSQPSVEADDVAGPSNTPATPSKRQNEEEIEEVSSRRSSKRSRTAKGKTKATN